MSTTFSTETPAEERAERVASEQGQRIVAAMHRTVGEQGANGATFDRVTREAGVARGSIFYYFGSKERLLVEVLRLHANERIEAVRQAVACAATPEGLVEAVAGQLDLFLKEDGTHVLVYEMAAAAPRSDALRTALGDFYRRWRVELADMLEGKVHEGVIDGLVDPESTACVLTSLGEGITLQALADPDRDLAPLLDRAKVAARALLHG